VLRRAMAIREGKHLPGVRLAEIRSPLARALFDLGGDPAHAIALARQAPAEYEQAANTPVVALDRAELEHWLHAHGSPSSVLSRRRVPKRTKATQPPKPSPAPTHCISLPDM
jgi:hypothetical protein